MDLHRLAEERSLAYHRAVAARLLADPALVDRARARVSTWLTSGDVHAEYARAWERILGASVHSIASSITDDSQEARALRQTTPFAGVVPPRERWAIWREVRRTAEAAGR